MSFLDYILGPKVEVRRERRIVTFVEDNHQGHDPYYWKEPITHFLGSCGHHLEGTPEHGAKVRCRQCRPSLLDRWLGPEVRVVAPVKFPRLVCGHSAPIRLLLKNRHGGSIRCRQCRPQALPPFTDF